MVERNCIEEKELKNNLLLQSKLADKEQKLDIADGDIFKDIQEVWEVAISRVVTTTISTAMTGVISREKT